MADDAPLNLTAALARVDLNLLLALDTLLRERSVTRSAAVLGMGQPAMSAALARLRRYFHDDLLIRTGNSYELTPLGVTLAQRTSVALASVGQVFGSHASFDPVTSTREFTLCTSDYAATVLAGPLAAITRQRAPHVRLRLQHTGPAIVDNAPESLRDIDALLLPHGFVDNAPYRDLYNDRFVFVVAAENSLVDDHLTLRQLAEMSMVVTFQGPTYFTTAVKQLRMAGLENRVDIITESFVVVPFLLAGSERIGVIPALLARQFERMGMIRTVTCDFVFTELVEALWWHPIHDNDPGHRWLREMVVEAASAGH